MTGFGRQIGSRGEVKLGSPFLFVWLLAHVAGCSVDFSGGMVSPVDAVPPPGDGDDHAGQDDDDDPEPTGDGDGDGDGDTGDGDGPDLPASCGNSPDGTVETRKRYPHSLVDHYSKCTVENQTRTCKDGEWSGWSGQAAASECAVEALGICQPGIACAEGTCVASKTMPLVSQCLSRNGTSCGDDGECVNRCIANECAEPASAGGACDDVDDCASLACLGGGLADAACEAGLCVCPNSSYLRQQRPVSGHVRAGSVHGLEPQVRLPGRG